MKIDIQKAKDFFEKNRVVLPLDDNNKAGKKTPYIILWNGKQIKLSNGKSIWPSIGAAKSALRGKIAEERLAREAVIDIDQSKIRKSTYSSYDYLDRDYKEDCYQTILHELQQAGVLKFEPLK